MSSKRRIESLSRRVGVDAVPLSHIANVEDFTAAAAQLSDAQLMDALVRTTRELAQGMSDDELLNEIAKARQHIQEDPL